MKKEIINQVEEEIVSLLGELSTIDAISDEYAVKTKRLNDLYEIVRKESELDIERSKVQIENIKVNDENLIKWRELRNSSIWTGLKTGVEVIGIVAPIMFYSIWMNRGFEFEKEGTFTSTTFKGLIGKFKTTK